MSKPKGPKFEQTRDANVETRTYETSGRRERMGRTSVTIWCPFCHAGIEAFVWSLAGGGKRCTCGALFASGGNAYHFTAEKKARPIETVWGLRNDQNAPWERPMNDEELRKRNLDPQDYEPETEGRWAW